MTLHTPSSGSAQDPEAALRLAANAAFRRFREHGDPAGIADLFDLAAPQLRRMARHLAGDEATADDLVQATFLVALQPATFRPGADVLPWLAGVLQNQAALVHRRRARRLDPQRLLPEAFDDPAAGAAAAETLAEVEGVLAQLPEVYRSVVRLHLVHGLDAGEIAVALGRPGGTVRTQLMRGLAKCRELLPVGLAGLLAGLLPSVGTAAMRHQIVDAARRLTPLGKAAPAAVAWLSAHTALLALVAATLLLVPFWWWSAADEVTPPANAAATVVAAAAATPETAPAAPAAAERLVSAPAATSFVAAPFTIRGSVVDDGGVPVGDAEVLLWAGERVPAVADGGLLPPATTTVRTASNGTFEASAVGTACYLAARHAGLFSNCGIRGTLDGRPLVTGLVLTLDRLVPQLGRLLDAQGRPVVGHPLTATTARGSSIADQLPVVGFARADLPMLRATTDAQGRFAVDAVAGASYSWEVQHPEHPMLRVRHRPQDGPLELRLAAGAVAAGRVWRADGSPAVGAKVVANDFPPRTAVVDALGDFALHGLALRDGLLLRIDDPQSAIHCVPLGDSTTGLQVHLQPPQVLSGLVVDAAGAPVEGAELHLVGDRTIFTGFQYTEPSTWEFVFGRHRATTAADGAFRFERLYDGEFEFRLREPGAIDATVVQRVRSGTEGLRVLARGALLQRVALHGRLRDALTGAPLAAATITVWRHQGEPASWSGHDHSLRLVDGEYHFEGLTAGRVRLSFASPGHAVRELGELDLAPGQRALDVALAPARSLFVECRAGQQPATGQLRVHRGDRQWLPIQLTANSTSNGIELYEGNARLDGLPAELLHIVLERGGEAPREQIVDLTRAPTAPLRFELDDHTALSPAELGVVVFCAAADAELGAHVGTPDREWLQRVLADRRVTSPDAKTTIEVTSLAGAKLASAVIEPVPQPPGTAPVATEFRCEVQHADGTGQIVAAQAMPAVTLRFPAQAVELVLRSPGREPERRRLGVDQFRGEVLRLGIFLRPSAPR